MNHPLQPLIVDDHGIVRFKANEIVRYLLDAGTFDMNHLAVTPFEQNDREQFAQLIGYSLAGFAELPYVSDETYEAAGGAPVEQEDAPKESWKDVVVDTAIFAGIVTLGTALALFLGTIVVYLTWNWLAG